MTDNPPKKSRRVNFGPLAALTPFVIRYRWRVAAALFALTLAASATLVMPLAIRRMIDFGFNGNARIHIYFLALLGVAAVLAFASALRYYLVMTLGERVVADIRTAVFRHVTMQSAAFFDTARTGEVISRLTADTTLLKSVFGASASVALRNLITFIGATILMVVTSPRLSMFVLMAIPAIVLPLMAFGRDVRKRSRAAQDRLADATAYATENLSAIRTMQAFTAEPVVDVHFGRATEEAYQAQARSTLSRAILTAVAIFIIFASIVGVLWMGARDVLDGAMTPGTLSQFVLYAVFGAGALSSLSEVWSEIAQASGAAERIDELLRSVPAVQNPAHPVPLPLPPQGAVRFDNVTFAYPTRPDAAVLSGLSFAAEPGERLAIVGPSGAGKSTIFHLLLRFYDPVSGSIRMDGVDLRQATLSNLRQRIALVPQDVAVMGASVLDNIRYGHPEASVEAAHEAARLAHASEFIEKLPQGYDTLVGERGITLSGGQRQRIAIARAILRDAPVLLLDEATSALDAESEGLVQEALAGLMKGRTTLVIAHRLATVLDCDRILVVDGGKIVESGSHAALSAQNGLYARLAKMQFDTTSDKLSDTEQSVK